MTAKVGDKVIWTDGKGEQHDATVTRIVNPHGTGLTVDLELEDGTRFSGVSFAKKAGVKTSWRPEKKATATATATPAKPSLAPGHTFTPPPSS